MAREPLRGGGAKQRGCRGGGAQPGGGPERPWHSLGVRHSWGRTRTLTLVPVRLSWVIFFFRPENSYASDEAQSKVTSDSPAVLGA